MAQEDEPERTEREGPMTSERKSLAEQVAEYDLVERIADSLERIADRLEAIGKKLDQLAVRGGPPRQEQRFRGEYPPRRPRDDRPRDYGGQDRRGGPPGGRQGRYRRPGRPWTGG